MLKELITFLFITFVLLSCNVKKATINTYIDPTYLAGKVQKIAVFPAIYSKIESYEAENVNREIVKEFQVKNPGIELIRPNKAKKLLKQQGLADDWTTFLQKYAKYGRPDFQILSTIRSRLAIDAIMQGEIIDVAQKDGQYQVNTATTVVTIKYSIFELKRGKLIWEASSNGLKEIGLTFEKAPPIIDAIEPAMDRIIEWLPVL